jgi:hypothetical protein
MGNGSGFDVNQNRAKGPGGGEGAYAIRQWAHGISGRLWIAWVSPGKPANDPCCPPGLGLGIGLHGTANGLAWVLGGIGAVSVGGSPREPLWRVLGLPGPRVGPRWVFALVARTVARRLQVGQG